MPTVHPKINSINIGLPAKVTLPEGQPLYSGISKLPTSEKIYLNALGFEGDGVADNKNHGGPDKAVCAYCLDHFPFWKKEIGKKLSPGAFGENLSVTGLLETDIHLGDQFKIGDAVIECSQPRQPCYKLNKKFDISDMVHRVQNSGFTGYYFRVIQPGWVQSGMDMALIKEGSGEVSIESANRLMHRDKLNYKKMKQIIEETLLSERWKQTFKTRLDKRTPEDAKPRLEGK